MESAEGGDSGLDALAGALGDDGGDPEDTTSDEMSELDELLGGTMDSATDQGGAPADYGEGAGGEAPIPAGGAPDDEAEEEAAPEEVDTV